MRKQLPLDWPSSWHEGALGHQVTCLCFGGMQTVIVNNRTESLLSAIQKETGHSRPIDAILAAS